MKIDNWEISVETIRIAAWVPLMVASWPAVLNAQPALEACRFPEIAFGGAAGTPVAVSDTIEVRQQVTVG